jgi:uncharacterized membrane protein YozB (DUF420 family)
MFLIQPTINLVVQISLIIILAVGFLYRRKNVKRHATAMLIALLVQLMALMIIMGPTFAFFLHQLFWLLAPLTNTIFIHGVTGTVALVLSAVLLLKWSNNLNDFAACSKRKTLMVVTIAFWYISTLTGVVGYLLLYWL